MALSKGPLLTQRDILSLPRPAQPIVNPSGTRLVWPSTRYSFETAKTNRQLNLIELNDPNDKSTRKVGTEEVGAGQVIKEHLDNLEICWLDDSTIVFTKPSPPLHGAVTLSTQDTERLNDEEYKALKSNWSKQNEGGIQGTQVWAFNVDTKEEYLLGHFPVPISNLKTHQVLTACSSGHQDSEASSVLLAFSSNVFDSPTSTIYTYPREYAQYLSEQDGSDVKIYDQTFFRHWDEWTTGGRELCQIFLVRLSKNPEESDREEGESGHSEEEDEEEGFEKIDEREGRWAFEREFIRSGFENSEMNSYRNKEHRPKVIAPMQGTKLETPVGPFGSNSDFSISSTHLLIHAKDPNVSPSWHTRTNVYSIPLSPRSAGDRQPRLISIGTQGASSNPRFAPSPSHATKSSKEIPTAPKCAWLEMREDGYEADRNRIMVYDFATGERKGLTEEWDLSPSSFEWSLDGKSLLVTTEERGHAILYQVEVEGETEVEGCERKVNEISEPPMRLTTRDSISSVCPLPWKRHGGNNGLGDDKERDGLGNVRALLSINSFTHPNELSILTSRKAQAKDRRPEITQSLLSSLTSKLLSTKQLSAGEEFLFLGANGREVHGWILFPPVPPTQSGSQLSPLANLCHGGPQSAWTSSWSTRWNPQSYTAKGYVTVLINRTGSTGFGQEFCDSIQGDWGGSPFLDIVAGIEYVKKTWKDKIDPERMASLGASYGGFMQNWIQGHNDSLGFKCLVCHDGVFNLAQTYYSTDELYFPTREFGGAPWEVPRNYEKYNPANFIKNWRTPQLVIHGSRDYRLVESEGLGVFNTLQRLGIPSRLLIFPSENHWVLNPRNSLKWHEEVFRFIGEFTNTQTHVVE